MRLIGRLIAWLFAEASNDLLVFYVSLARFFFTAALVVKGSGSDDLAAVYLCVSLFFSGSGFGWNLCEKEDEKEMILYGSFLLIVSMFIGSQAGPWVFFIGLSLYLAALEGM